MAWVSDQPLHTLHFSVATIAEIDFGIERLDAGWRRATLMQWRDGLVQMSAPRILPVDLQVGSAWGVVRARAATAGRPMPLMDALLAATAEVHGLTVVTRNVKDFEVWGGPVHNPWTHA